MMTGFAEQYDDELSIVSEEVVSSEEKKLCYRSF